MYNKVSLKQKHNVIAVLMSALLSAGIIIGCGVKANDPGGGSEPVAEKVEAPEVVSTETAPDVTADTKDEDTKDAETKDAEADVGAENILEREKPVIKDDYYCDEHCPTNKFIMVEEVADPGEDKGYVKVKGTLYEVYLDGAPDYDLVYFPGDELPEGYEVKVTEDYEAVLEDWDRFGEGHSIVTGSAYLAKEDASHKISYKYFTGCSIWDNDLDPNISKDESYPVEPAIEPGMYGMLTFNNNVEGFPSTTFIQALLKDQMPTDGTEVSDDVMHQ